MSTPEIEQLTAAQKASAEVMTTLMRTAFEGMQKMAELNMAATRDFFNTTVANANTVMSLKDVKDLSKVNESLAKPNFDQLLGYSRSVYELMAEMQQEIGSIMESQYSQFAKNATTAIDKSKAAPVGGDVFAAAMKSMLDATNNAYNNISTMAKQMSDIAEANVKSASSATAKAVGSRAKKYAGTRSASPADAPVT